MKWLLRSGYRILVHRCLPSVWQCLIDLGSLHTGRLYYEEAQVLSILGQAGCFVDHGPVSRGRQPAQADGRLPGGQVPDGQKEIRPSRRLRRRDGRNPGR